MIRCVWSIIRRCYSKRLLNIIIICLEGLWLAEAYGKYCDDNKMAYIEPDKMKCQKRCEQDANCIGISYTDNDTFDFLCYHKHTKLPLSVIPTLLAFLNNVMFIDCCVK